LEDDNLADAGCSYVKGTWCTLDPKYKKLDEGHVENYCNTAEYINCPIYEKYGYSQYESCG